jgi:hypothetical protein
VRPKFRNCIVLPFDGLVTKRCRKQKYGTICFDAFSLREPVSTSLENAPYQNPRGTAAGIVDESLRR